MDKELKEQTDEDRKYLLTKEQKRVIRNYEANFPTIRVKDRNGCVVEFYNNGVTFEVRVSPQSMPGTFYRGYLNDEAMLRIMDSLALFLGYTVTKKRKAM